MAAQTRNNHSMCDTNKVCGKTGVTSAQFCRSRGGRTQASIPAALFCGDENLLFAGCGMPRSTPGEDIAGGMIPLLSQEKVIYGKDSHNKHHYHLKNYRFGRLTFVFEMLTHQEEATQ